VTPSATSSTTAEREHAIAEMASEPNIFPMPTG
jgi:hypothetical protein